MSFDGGLGDVLNDKAYFRRRLKVAGFRFLVSSISRIIVLLT